jgi:hypothetical protein
MAGRQNNPIARTTGSQLQVTNTTELKELADVLYRGGLAPAGIDNPNKVAAVILAGFEVGLPPTQALGSIMLTNGRLSIYGDGAMALVRASGLLESIREWVDGDGDARTGHCVVKRKGEPEREFTFSIADAKRAGLIERAMGKDGKGKGPWVSYPDRMLIARPRGFAFRDVFPDVLRGLITYEEAVDTVETVQATVVSSRVDNTPALPPAAPPVPATVVVQATVDAAMSQQPAPTVAQPAPITEAQKSEIGVIKAMLLNQLGTLAKSDAERDAIWPDYLEKHYGVRSAIAFTADQAARFIEVERPKFDPFTHGQTSSTDSSPSQSKAA